jgi:hypothetical protein
MEAVVLYLFSSMAQHQAQVMSPVKKFNLSGRSRNFNGVAAP